MDFQVIFSQLATEDLREIVTYIAKNDSSAAERMGYRLLDHAGTLRHLPHRGAPVRRRPSVRKLVMKSYLIFYRIDDAAREAHILRIWHGAQDPDRLYLDANDQ